MFDPTKDKTIAVKVTTEPSQMEQRSWCQLNHLNILPLLEVITFPRSCVFITPLLGMDLETKVNQDGFYTDLRSLSKCRVWIKDVLKGLAYMHGENRSHLDLKLNNVLLDGSGRAIICDFGLMGETQIPANTFFLPALEPPEFIAYKANHGEQETVVPLKRGDMADMWMLGILAIDLLSKMKICTKMETQQFIWESDVSPLLKKILDGEHYMRDLLKTTFRPLRIPASVSTDCLKFLKGVLNFDPLNRSNALQANEDFVNIGWPEFKGPIRITNPDGNVIYETENTP